MKHQETPENARDYQDDDHDDYPMISRSESAAPHAPELPPDEIDEQLAAIADFFDGLQTGVSVMVSRLEPEWCSGYLEEKEIIEGQEPIDINYLIKTWGGKRLRIRVRSKRAGTRGQWLRSIDIPLQTWDPLRRGKPIYPRDSVEESENWTTKKPEQRKNGFGELSEMMGLLATMRQSELATLQALGVGRPFPAPRGDGGDRQTLSVAVELAKTFAQMNRPQTDEGAGMELFSKALDIIRPSAPAPAPRIVSAGAAPESLAESLARLPPTEAVGTLQSALSRMTPDRQRETMGVLLRGLQDTGMLDVDEDEDTDTDPEAESPDNS